MIKKFIHKVPNINTERSFIEDMNHETLERISFIEYKQSCILLENNLKKIIQSIFLFGTNKLIELIFFYLKNSKQCSANGIIIFRIKILENPEMYLRYWYRQYEY